MKNNRLLLNSEMIMSKSRCRGDLLQIVKVTGRNVENKTETGAIRKVKKRFSIDKAEWSDTREEQYRKDCLDIVVRFGDTMDTKDSTVYIIKNGEQMEIAKPLKSKTFWYETWLKVKDFYGV